MRARRQASLALCAAAGLALLTPVPAHAERDLWATVNVCDTTAFPDTMGVRASMPGTKPRRRLLMRFERPVLRPRSEGGSCASETARAGCAWARAARSRCSRASTSASTPRPAGSSFTLRGVVDFRWMGRRNGRWRVVKRATKITRAGIRDVEDSDPPGYSRALCQIKGP